MYYNLFRDMACIANPHENLSSRYGHEIWIPLPKCAVSTPCYRRARKTCIDWCILARPLRILWLLGQLAGSDQTPQKQGLSPFPLSISLGHGWWCSLAGQSPHCHDNGHLTGISVQSGLATSWKQTFNESSTDSLTKVSYLLWIVWKQSIWRSNAHPS